MTDFVSKNNVESPAEIAAHDANAITLLLSRAGRRIRAGQLSVVTPSGGRLVFKGSAEGPSARIIIHRWRALASIGLHAGVGLGQSYARGDWDSSNLPALIAFLVANIDRGARHTLGARISRRIRHMATRLNPNTLAGIRHKVAFHYDIGNRFYQAWLDPSWSYSGALFAHPEMTLQQAQRAKYQRIAERLSIAPGDQILEIGCGWGGFALFAASEFGARVTGITLSKEQLSLARQRAEDAGVADRVRFELLDYRELDGQFSHIVSIEMLEAVGEAYWPNYFEILSRCLAPGGSAAIQSIVIDPVAFPSYRKGSDFIQTCVFPGGMLPTAPIITDQARRAGLWPRNEFLFGAHYARTLNAWRQNFNAAADELTAQGFDKYFCRLWNFYLAYCEGGFLSGRVDVGQWILEKPASSVDKERLRS